MAQKYKIPHRIKTKTTKKVAKTNDFNEFRSFYAQKSISSQEKNFIT